MRLNKISIRNFRAFPSPTTYDFNFGDATNLVVYGENGSGKSSLFRAIQEYLNRSVRARDFSSFKNIYSGDGRDEGFVSFHFDDGASYAWNADGDRQHSQDRIAEMALRAGCLDYRSLLATNYGNTLRRNVNLFEIATSVLLANFPVSVGGRRKTIGDLWETVSSSVPNGHYKRQLDAIHIATAQFNQAVTPLLDPLAREIETMLAEFDRCQFRIEFRFPGVSYDEEARKLTKLALILEVFEGGNRIAAHHDFLNEARLSAIALALYFAGLIRTVPAPVPGAPSFPKLLVLDDVLVGLDMANRLPVLRILDSRFADWQLVILTHDRVWYEIIHALKSGDPSWCFHELYSSHSETGVLVPIHNQPGTGWDRFLTRAEEHLANRDERAAAVYARSAFELRLKRYAEKKNVPVPFRPDPSHVSAEDLWVAIKKAREANPQRWASEKPKFDRVQALRKVVLNPLSHSAPASVTSIEVQEAIAAVRNLPL